MEDASDVMEKVVDSDQLEMMTTLGWSVVERYDEDEPVELTEEALPPEGPSSRYYPGQSHNGLVTLRKTALGRKSLFRLRRDRSAIVSELMDQLSQARTATTVAEKARIEAEKQMAAFKDDKGRVNDENTRMRTSAEQLRKQLSEAQEVKARLERDLGKLREHIGRKTFDEVLGPALPKSV